MMEDGVETTGSNIVEGFDRQEAVDCQQITHRHELSCEVWQRRDIRTNLTKKGAVDPSMDGSRTIPCTNGPSR